MANVVVKKYGSSEPNEGQVSVGDGIYVYDGEFIIAHYYVIGIGEPVINASEGTDAGKSVTATVTYPDAEGMRFDLYLAAYDNDGKLIGVTVKEVTTTGSGEVLTAETDSITLSAPAKELKAFVWDDNLKPLSNAGHD